MNATTKLRFPNMAVLLTPNALASWQGPPRPWWRSLRAADLARNQGCGGEMLGDGEVVFFA